jgi:hypothetical protein
MSSSCPISFMLEGSASSASPGIGEGLAAFPVSVLSYAAERETRIIPLSLGQRYRDASPALRRLGVGVDAWPDPPAGLFVVEERTIYLRDACPMTVAHEFGHALDCALGGGVYRSGYDVHIRYAFSMARKFVSSYAAYGLDEYFAESVRAFVGVNDSACPWPKVSRARLKAIDARMYACIEGVFEECAS